MATATTKATAAEDLLMLLSGDPVPATDVIAKVGESALSLAWVRGDVEFGQVNHCVTGRPGIPESKPTLYIEDGISWTGPKTPRHKQLRKVLSDGANIPNCQHYRKYVRQVSKGKDAQGFEHWRTVERDDVPEGVEVRWTTEAIEKDEAVKLMRLVVKLTDKGMAALQS